MIKPLIVGHSDSGGGAAKATYRLHTSLRKLGFQSEMLVNVKRTSDIYVNGPLSKSAKAIATVKPHIGSLFCNFSKTDNKILHSPAIIPSSIHKRINEHSSDVVNLHWINGEMIPIWGIPKIKKPVVWTLHDMWAFCGSEHVSYDTRWIDGYARRNRSSEESGFDINRFVWLIKKYTWKNPINIVTPSSWMASNVKKSLLMHDWPVTVIPNPIDTDFWRPVDRKLCRMLLRLPLDKKLILFGSHKANDSLHKGWDLLLNALSLLGDMASQLEVVILGTSYPEDDLYIPLKCHFIDHLNDDISLLSVYNAVDLVAIPSRIDNFPNMATEAHSCGIPVIAFDTAGLSDVIENESTGLLAAPFNCKDYAQKIKLCIDGSINLSELGANARQKALDLWSENTVCEQYANLYQELIESYQHV